MPDILHTLKTTFGYEAFRPFQREIIESALSNRDVFALLPTGGGKSLCFQIPALHRQGLTIVVSPLIALMKDQVDQLQATGVAATFLNSSLGEKESRRRLAHVLFEINHPDPETARPITVGKLPRQRRFADAAPCCPQSDLPLASAA